MHAYHGQLLMESVSRSYGMKCRQDGYVRLGPWSVPMAEAT